MEALSGTDRNQSRTYDVVGGGGHKRAAAYCRAEEFGGTDVAVVEKGLEQDITCNAMTSQPGGLNLSREKRSETPSSRAVNAMRLHRVDAARRCVTTQSPCGADILNCEVMASVQRTASCHGVGTARCFTCAKRVGATAFLSSQVTWQPLSRPCPPWVRLAQSGQMPGDVGAPSSYFDSHSTILARLVTNPL